MSVLIKGMEMPSSGLYFVSVDNTGGRDKTIVTVERMLGNRDVRQIVGSFELVPVPPHGRLIDADELIREHRADNYDFAIYACYLVQNAPTIIPSDGNMDTDFWGEEYAEAKGLAEEGE